MQDTASEKQRYTAEAAVELMTPETGPISTETMPVYIPKNLVANDVITQVYGDVCSPAAAEPRMVSNTGAYDRVRKHSAACKPTGRA